MAPNRVEKMKAMARLQPKRAVRTARAVEEEPEHLCQVCFKSFSSAQALGGHKNAHRREREEARNSTASAQSTRWVPASPSAAPLMRGCVYVVGHPQFLYVPERSGSRPLVSGGAAPLAGSWQLQRSHAGEGSGGAPRTTGPLLVPPNSSSRALKDPCSHGAEGHEDPSGEIDLTLRL